MTFYSNYSNFNAFALGLCCPESIVTNSREQLIRFYEANGGEIISKPIYFSKYFSKGDITYSVQTRKYDEDMISGLPEFFFPNAISAVSHF